MTIHAYTDPKSGRRVRDVFDDAPPPLAIASDLVPPVPRSTSLWILFASGCGWSDCGAGQRPPQLAKALAARGYDVFYYSNMDAYAKRSDGVHILCRDEWPGWLDQAQRHPGIAIVALATYFPTVVPLVDAGWRLVYDLIDDWQAFVDCGELPGYVLGHEPELLARAELVTCSAPALMERAHALGATRTALIPNGGPRSFLSVPEKPPADMGTDGIRAVYVCCMIGKWFDWEPIKELAAALKFSLVEEA